MSPHYYKVHTDNLGRLSACVQYAMYGISNEAFHSKLPDSMKHIQIGDIVFISEKEISGNALFGPFYVVNTKEGVVSNSKVGCWNNIDLKQSDYSKLAYWVELEKWTWCLLFDITLLNQISVVWPRNWRELHLNLPPWGQIPASEAKKLLDFSIENQINAKEFFRIHDIYI